MSAFTLINNVKVSLAADISSSAATITFNNPSAPFNPVSVNSGEVGCITLVDDPVNTTHLEIITFTGSSSAAGVVTCTGCVRGVEGTTAKTWTANTLAFMDATAAVLKSLIPSPQFFTGSFFGNGSDGNVTINSAQTATRDMFYNNLTLVSGGSLNMGGFRLYVVGTLDLTAADAGAIHGAAGANGNNGVSSGSTLGGDGGAGITLPPGANGGVGGTVHGAGAADQSSATAGSLYLGGFGHIGSGPIGGGASGSTKLTVVSPYMSLWNGTTAMFAAAGGGGGDSGSFAGGTTGGSGGGGGGALWIAANTIARGASTPTGCLKGGDGGNGGAHYSGDATSGYGGGGGGGSVYVFYANLTGTAVPSGIQSVPGTNAIGGIGAGGDILVQQMIGSAPAYTFVASTSATTSASL